MFAEVLLTAALLADLDVVDRVEDRVGPTGGLAKGTAESISYQRISTVGSTNLIGGGSLDTVRLQVSCWAMSSLDALELAGVVRDAIAPADSIGIATFQGLSGPTKDLDTGQWGAVADYFIMEERA